MISLALPATSLTLGEEDFFLEGLEDGEHGGGDVESE